MSRSRRRFVPNGRLAAAVVAASLLPAVAACEAGGNAPTMHFHDQAIGTDAIQHGIQISDAFVLGPLPGGHLGQGQTAGLFLSLYNNTNGADRLIGASAPGVASSVYPTMRMPQSSATIRFEDGRYVTEIGAADLGTGAWTVLPQIAADALGVPVADVDVRIGDTRYPTASVAGGSSGTNTWGSAIVVAAHAFRDKFGGAPVPGDEVTGDVDQAPADDAHASYAFGAQFAEARVHADTGEIRVPRLLGVFGAGRIINPRLARSQFIGGMTMGLSMALHETSVMDPRLGQVVNHDFAEYHIAANADVTSIEAYWLDEYDPYVNAMGSKGIGEIGIVGTAAAVANAVHHATGVRIRDLPVTLDKLLAALP